MSTSNNIFINSSVLVEALKGNKVDFYKSLISDSENIYFINDTVVSEYLYHVIAFSSGTSPKTAQQKKQIHSVISQETSQIEILINFHYLKAIAPFCLKFHV